MGAAARQVGLTQQALSSSIVHLEEVLGVPLFERTQRGMKPTLYASHLLKHARHLLDDGARAISTMRALRTAGTGEVRVGLAETVAGLLAARAAERLLKRMPSLTMSLTEGYSEQMVELLLNGQVDIAIASPPASWVGSEDLTAEPIFVVSESVFMRAGHPLARRENVTLTDLHGSAWIQGRYLTESYEALCKMFVQGGLSPPKRILWSDSLSTGIELLLRNDFLAFICPSLISREIERRDLIMVRCDQLRSRERVVYVFRRRRSVSSPAIESMVDEIRALITDPTMDIVGLQPVPTAG